MKTNYRSIAALLLTVTLVVMGQGVLNTIVPLSAKAHHQSEVEIGLLGSAYFAGMLLGALLNPAMIRRVGHVRAFTASIAVSTIAALIYTFSPNIWLWVLLRVIGGFAIAGLYATVEGWLQAKSDNSSRGHILAIYSIVQYVAMAGGNTLLQFAAPTDFVLYAVSAVCFSLGILPMTVTEQSAPERPSTPKLPIIWALKTCPLGVIGVFLVGLNNGPMWSLSPIFGANIGLSAADIGTMMIMMTLGSAALQLPIGRLSDRFDRRKVAVALLVVTTLIELTLWRFGLIMPRAGLYGLSFALGAVVSTQYYVLVAYTNDIAGPTRAVGIAAVMLFSYCVGAVVGPTTATTVMTWLGPSALHLHDATVHATMAMVFVFELFRGRSKGKAAAVGAA